MNNIRLLFLTLIVFAAAATAFSQNNVQVGSAAPAFSAASVDGSYFDLSEMRGSVVVITFWSSRCGICRVEMPKLDAMVDQYASNKVIFLALTMENEEKIAGYLRSNPFKFHVLPNSFGILLQYADRDKAGVVNMGFPSFFVIDQQGRVQYRSSGYDKTGALSSTIRRLVSSD